MRAFFRLHLPIIALFFVVALLITFPSILTASTRLIGGDTSDSGEVARHMWWFTHSLRTGQDFFYQSNLGYPDGFSSTVFLSVPLYVLPMGLFAFVMPLALAFNLTIWLTLALNGWAMFLLARDRLQAASIFPALIAGLVFMAAPVFQSHVADGHSGLIVMWPFPLYLLALFKLVEAPRLNWRWLAAAVIFFLLSPMGHILQSIYVLLPISGLFWLARVWKKDWRGAGRVLLVGLIGGVIYALYLLPVVVDILAEPAYSGTQGYVRFSLDALAIATPSFFNPVFDALLSYPRAVLGTNLTEGSAYVGVLVALLAIIGLWRGQGRARWWLLVAVVVWVLALGPVLKVFDQPVVLDVGDGYETYVTLPWAAIQNLPGFSIARTPGRFAFGLALAVAMLAGFGAKALSERIRMQRRAQYIVPLRIGLFIIAAAIILFEYQFYWPMPTRSAEIPQAVADLRQRDNVRAVFNVPYENLLAAKDALLLQTAHHLPLIAGQVSRTTPVNPAKLYILQATLNPALLNEVGADMVIYHKTRYTSDEGLNQRLLDQLGQPTYEDEQIAIFDVPQSETVALWQVVDEMPRPIEIQQPTNSYIYSPSAAWITIQQAVTGDERTLVIEVDGRLIQRVTVNGTQELTLTVPITEAGFHTLTYRLEPPCPIQYDDTLACRSVTLDDAQVDWLYSLPSSQVAIEGGIHIAAAQLHHDLEIADLSMWWQFDEAIDDHMVRFVHIIDASGQPVLQNDMPLGRFAAGEGRAETVRFDLADLPPGEYGVRMGWYRLADDGQLTNLPVLDGEFAGQNAVMVGTISIPD
ncbi:MAG: hypothetical protein H6670_03160 [Anaerolineaceae bacterium]|nr:hypothetical protein [Anaerolineaceae bacterium]